MCDYSLESAARRDAAAGDQLTTARLGLHGTIGLTASNDPSTAVCLKPGTRLIISAIPAELQQRWGVGEVATATFGKNGEQPVHQGLFRHSYYRDGVIFDGTSGPFVLFQEFPLGAEISVEVLPGAVTRDTVKAPEPVLA